MAEKSTVAEDYAERSEPATTPLAKPLPVPKHTPPPPPRPTAKLQLAAAKRMQAELNKVEKKKKKDKREGACGKPAEGNQVSEAGEASGSKQSKKKRKAHDGPVMHAYREFIADCRQGGLSFRQSVEAWKDSLERARLISQMSEGERKRRRFEPTIQFADAFLM